VLRLVGGAQDLTVDRDEHEDTRVALDLAFLCGVRMITSQHIIDFYFANNFRLVYWPQIGDSKGPRDKGWTERAYTRDEYHDGSRVGIICGHEISAGRILHDVDIDWAPGSRIAQALLPQTDFIFGRASKKISHCWYTLPEALPSFKYEDPSDKTCLIELRGTKLDGELGMQTMAPPSVWSKDTAREPLEFVKFHLPSHIEQPTALKQKVCMSAIAMLLAKHFGVQGFGHEMRLAWAGFLLRAGLSIDECLMIGNAIMLYTGNSDKTDIRLAVESTHKRLEAKDKKVKGGPALAKMIGEHGRAIVKRINEWLGRDSDFIRNVDGLIIRDHQENIARALSMLNIELRYNEFSDKLLMNQQPLEDRQLNETWLRIDEEYHFRPSSEFFEKVVKRMAWNNSYHPVRDYFATLQWDHVPRIDTWLIRTASAEDTPYVRAISAIVLIAAVKRIKSPGCKYDELLVLESKQGLQKSSALRALCPNPDWFTDDFQLNVGSQRTIESTTGKWLIEVSELSGMRPAEREILKANLSRQVDGPARMAYAHLPIERPRQFILIGTTNSKEYLADSTGARRFWPCEVKKFDVAWILANREQLWAEAVTREAAGESHRLAEELWPAAEEEQEQRREIDPWEGLIRHALLSADDIHRDHTRVVTTFLWDSLGVTSDRRSRRDSLRLTEIMQRLGFKRTRVRPVGEAVQIGFISTMYDWPTWVQSSDHDAHEAPARQNRPSDTRDDTF
jgi:hypothetical protein